MPIRDTILKAPILIVDDEPANIKLLQMMLQAGGFQQVHATGDPHAVEELYEAHQPDLVILDLNMPQRDGFEVLAALKEQHAESLAPVLVLTAQTAREFSRRALESGSRDFVSKPFDRIELLSRINNLLEMRTTHQALHRQNQHLDELVRNRTRELYDTRLEIVRRLGRAAEYRDNETGLHIIRMSTISVLLGKAVGMVEDQCELLLNAAPMHDIGKIGIPDHILLKPGKLDPQEWEIMKTHATIGGEILAGNSSELMVMARDIALSHHEKWDGSGYPFSLAGEDIPLVGRIVAIADVFDALTSERPYKKAWPLEDAIAYIRDSAGTHFDPQLVDVFLSQLDEINQITRRYAEPGE